MLLAPLFCFMGESSENITKPLSLSKWISQGIFQFPLHFYLRNTKHPHQTTCSSPEALRQWHTHTQRSSKKERMGLYVYS